MRIGFDATSLCRKKTGIEYYALNLSKSLLRFDAYNQYIIFFRREVPPELAEFKDRAKFIVCPVDCQIFCEQIWLPYIAVREKVDLVHFPAFPPGILTSKKHVLTIHDATIWKFPETLSWKGRYYLKPLAVLGSKRAIKVITVSESARLDAAKYACIAPDKVINAGESIGEGFRKIEDRNFLENIRLKYGLPEKFILSVGSVEPRKNLSLLLEAFKRMRSDTDFAGHRLVLVGRKAWGNDILQRKITGLGLEGIVFTIGYVPDEDLVAIYNLAEVFVYPSYYEGFGLPPLEAMACGTPVVASNVSSLQEVLAEAALFVDPHDAEGLYQCIKRILKDDDLRAGLRAKGFRRIGDFSWEEVAKKMAKIYRSVG